MQKYALSHLTDEVLLRNLKTLVVQDRAITAILLAHIAEVDGRRLYVPAGFPSMHVYCVKALGLSDDAAFSRIRAARAARRFPAIFRAVEQGELHLTAICLLAPHLTPDNVEELTEACTHTRKADIEEMLARRFPLRALSVRTFFIRALGPATAVPTRVSTPELDFGQAGGDQLVPERVANDPERVGNLLVPERVGGDANDQLVPVETRPPPAQSAPLQAPQSASPPPIAPPQATADRFLLRLMVERCTLEKLRHVQALLSHAVPSGDLTRVLDRALDHAIARLEKQKLGNAAQPNRARKPVGRRHIPKRIRRAVWERDQGQCTFVSADGTRCDSSSFLQFDHIQPVARGGKASVDGIRLRCRAHNQYEAERVFGAEFMNRKRREAKAAKETGLGSAERQT
jgi:hypothetical protein